MKRTLNLGVALLGIALFFASCKDSKSELPVPKDAIMVMHINSESLTSKLTWDEIKSSPIFKESAETIDDSLGQKLMENPENSGIDTKGGFVMFVKQQGNGSYVVFEGKLKDADAFETLVKEVHSPAPEVKKEGGVKYVAVDNSLLSWNNSSFMIIGSAGNMAGRGLIGSGRKDFRLDSLKKFTKEIMNLDKSASLESDSRYTDLIKTGDFHFWLNYDDILKSSGMISMMKTSLFENNIITYALNFDEGRIVVSSKVHANEQLAKLWAKYNNRVVSKELINRIPSGDVVGMMAYNFDPAVMKEIITSMGAEGFINGFLADVNFTLDELLNSTDGQFLLSFSDLEVKSVEKTIEPYYQGMEPIKYTDTEHNAKVLFAASVKNKATIEKLMALVEGERAIKDTSIKYKITDQWFAAGNQMPLIDQFLSGTTVSQPFADKIAGHPFGMYIDLQKVVNGMHPASQNAYDSTLHDLNLKLWQDVVGTGGETDGNSCSIEIVVNMVDKSKNSLKQLFEFSNKMYEAKKLRIKKNDVAADNSDDEGGEVIISPQSN